MGRRARQSKPQKARTYSVVGKYGEYDITAGSYNEAMFKLDKAEKIHELQLKNPDGSFVVDEKGSGSGQTFLENAADEFSFGGYSKVKSKLLDEDQDITDARMERNAQENPIAGMAGTGVGLVAGGGGVGGAVKGAAKLAGKGLAKAGAAKIGNAVQKVPVGKFKRGVYEGAAAGAGIEAIEAGKDLYSGDDISAGSVAGNIAFGAAGGGVLGTLAKLPIGSGIPRRLNTRKGDTLDASKEKLKNIRKSNYGAVDKSPSVFKHKDLETDNIRLKAEGDKIYPGQYTQPENFLHHELDNLGKLAKSNKTSVRPQELTQAYKRSRRNIPKGKEQYALKKLEQKDVRNRLNRVEPGLGNKLAYADKAFETEAQIKQLGRVSGAVTTSEKKGLLKDKAFQDALKDLEKVNKKEYQKLVKHLSGKKFNSVTKFMESQPSMVGLGAQAVFNPKVAAGRLVGHGAHKFVKGKKAKEMAENAQKALLRAEGLNKKLGMDGDYSLSTYDAPISPKAAKLGDFIYTGSTNVPVEPMKSKDKK